MIQASYKTGTITQNGSTIVLDVQGLASLALDLTGTFVGTVVFEYTINGTDWYTLTVNLVGSSSTVTGATAVGKWTANVAGFQTVRVRCTAFTSGSIVVAMRAVLAGGGSGSGSGGGGDIQSAGADAGSNTANAQTVNSRISGFNGTTWDRIRTAVTTVSATLTGFLNTLPWGIYHATPTTRTEGQGGPLETDASGNLKVTLATQLGGENLTDDVMGVQNKPVASSTYSPTLYAPLTQVTKNVIKASAGNVLGIYITNDNAAVRYFQLHNKATAPAAAEVPIRSLKIPAGTANNPGVLILGRDFFGPGGQYLATGIGWAVSTTLATFTDSATNTEHIVNVDYV